VLGVFGGGGGSDSLVQQSIVFVLSDKAVVKTAY